MLKNASCKEQEDDAITGLIRNKETKETMKAVESTFLSYNDDEFKADGMIPGSFFMAARVYCKKPEGFDLKYDYLSYAAATAYRDICDVINFKRSKGMFKASHMLMINRVRRFMSTHNVKDWTTELLSELAIELGVQVDTALGYVKEEAFDRYILELDAEMSDDSNHRVGEYIPASGGYGSDPQDVVVRKSVREDLESLLDLLPEKEATVASQCGGAGELSYEAASAITGLSAFCTKGLCLELQAWLRKKLWEKGYDPELLFSA